MTIAPNTCTKVGAGALGTRGPCLISQTRTAGSGRERDLLKAARSVSGKVYPWLV